MPTAVFILVLFEGTLLLPCSCDIYLDLQSWLHNCYPAAVIHRSTWLHNCYPAAVIHRSTWLHNCYPAAVMHRSTWLHNCYPAAVIHRSTWLHNCYPAAVIHRSTWLHNFYPAAVIHRCTWQQPHEGLPQGAKRVIWLVCACVQTVAHNDIRSSVIAPDAQSSSWNENVLNSMTGIFLVPE